jgi:thiamine-monophosphate kinase
MTGETLRSIGEFGLIARLAQQLAPAGGRRLLVDIGDDAAAWMQGEACLVATTDMLAEGVHFDLSFSTWRDLGWKALAANLSDIAAMGAKPEWAFASIGLRPDTPAADVAELYAGMQDLALPMGCSIAGGDTIAVRTDQIINVLVVGSIPAAEADTLLRRDRGRVGDVVAVTGTLGGSAAGLHVLQGQQERTGVAALLDAHLRPQPRIEPGRLLRKVGVRCAMDVSDGLLADLEKLCERSGCGAEVHAELIPAHPEMVARFPDHALEWAAAGGEDYELLFTASEQVIAAAHASLDHLGVPVTSIGRLTEKAGVRLLDAKGSELPLSRRGWDHFGLP